MSNDKNTSACTPRNASELFEKVRDNRSAIRFMATGIRSRPDYDKPSVRAMVESQLLMAVEILEEVEAYLQEHLPRAKLIELPIRQSDKP